MMFSERLEHGKYDLKHLQDTVRTQKPAQFYSDFAGNGGKFSEFPAKITEKTGKLRSDQKVSHKNFNNLPQI